MIKPTNPAERIRKAAKVMQDRKFEKAWKELTEKLKNNNLIQE